MMDTPAQKIGFLLKEKREQLGHSIQDIAEYTRIRKVYIESIESGQLDELPGQAYITGFIRVYARYLGLDSDLLLRKLEEPQESDELKDCDALSSTPVEENPLPSQSDETSPKSKGWGTFVVGFIAVLILGGLVYFSPSLFPAKESGELISNETLPATTSTQTQDTPIEEKGESTHDQPLPADVVSAVVLEEAHSPLSSLPTIPPAGSVLRMLALTESSLIIYVDDRKPQEYKLSEGLDLSWPIESKVKVEMAEPDVVRFWLGKEELSLDKLSSFQLQSTTDE